MTAHITADSAISAQLHLVKLHLVSIAMNPRAFDAYAVSTKTDDDDRGFATHLALRQRFGAAGPQPFKLMADDLSRLHVLGYTSDPQALLEMADLPATDSLLDSLFPAAPRIKAMPENWAAGSRYGFEVKVRPVVRYSKRQIERRQAEGKHPSAERDAFLAAVENTADGSANINRSDVYAAWLSDRMRGVAEITSAEISAMRQVRTRRSPHGSGKNSTIDGYEATFKGQLTVENPAQFALMLQRGIGRHTAFGYGMLLLRPPGR